MLERLALSIGAGQGHHGAVIADKDLAHTIWLDLVAAALRSQGTLFALFGREGKGATLATLRSIGRGADLAAWASQRPIIGRQGEVVRAEALTALFVRIERRHQLGLTITGLGNVGLALARAGRLVVDEFSRCQVVMTRSH